MDIDNKNKISYKFLQNDIITIMKNVGDRRDLVLWSFVSVRAGMAPCWNKLTLRRKTKNLRTCRVPSF